MPVDLSLRVCPARTPAEPGYPDSSGGDTISLRIGVLYEDGLTREWAMQKCRRAEELAGRQYVEIQCWELDGLTNPERLSKAVSDAAGADVLIVAVHATAALPATLAEWGNRLVAARPPIGGALVALVGLSADAGKAYTGTGEYLRSIANRGRLDFLTQEFKEPRMSDLDAVAAGAACGRTTSAAAVKIPASSGQRASLG